MADWVSGRRRRDIKDESRRLSARQASEQKRPPLARGRTAIDSIRRAFRKRAARRAKRKQSWIRRHRVPTTLVGAALAGVFLVLNRRWDSPGFSIFRLELAATPHEGARALSALAAPVRPGAPLAPLLEGNLDRLRGQLWADAVFFIPGYVIGLIGLSRFVRKPGAVARPWAAFGRAVTVLTIMAGVLDEIENLALWRVVRAADRAPSSSTLDVERLIPSWATKLASLCATLKFVALFVVAGYVLFGLLGTLGRALQSLRHARPSPTTWRASARMRAREQAWTQPEHLEPDGDPEHGIPPWRMPTRGAAESSLCDKWMPAADRIGIACSGGGVRSAAINLGALQYLREVDEPGTQSEFDKAKYLAAVSGGGYIAAAITYADSDPAPPPCPTRPWARGSPEEKHLRNNSSYLAPALRDKLGALLRALVGLALNLVLVALVVFLAARPVGWALSSIHPELRARLPIVTIDEQPNISTDPMPVSGTSIVVDPNPGTIALTLKGPSGTRKVAAAYTVSSGSITTDAVPRIQQQPRLEIEDPLRNCGRVPAPECDDVENNDGTPYVAPDQPLTGKLIPGDTLRFQVEQQPTVRAVSRFDGRKHIAIGGWMWKLIGGLLALAFLLAIVGMLTRTARGDTVWGRWAYAFAGAAAASFALLIALPWLARELPHALSVQARHLPDLLQLSSGTGGATPATYGPALALAGVVSAVAGAARGLFARKPRLIGGILATVAVYAVIAIGLITAMAYAASFGMLGHLTEWHKNWSGLSDWQWAAIFAGSVALFTYFADVNAWSLYTFYKQRLQSAYIVERATCDEVQSIAFDHFIFLDEAQNKTRPELVLCAAANITDAGFTPPGRRAVSFTFSATEVGGREVHWVPTGLLYDRLSPARQRDVTLTAAMAISGAALSPAMGKKSMAGFSALLALLNVRLGVWLPHPGWVEAQDGDFEWQDKPRLQHLAMEVFGLHPFDHPYLYVTDGGHWDNLGLVELLRRGCTKIYCFDASGDQVDTFFTIGEAVALARSDLGIDINIRPDVMRTPLTAPSDGRKLLRWPGDTPAETAVAPTEHAIGTFTPVDPITLEPMTGIEGRIVIGKATITDDVPWDVFAHAEKDPKFPTNSTLEQLYTDEKFESYRALGRHIATRSRLAMNTWAGQAVLVTVPAQCADTVLGALGGLGVPIDGPFDSFDPDATKTFILTSPDADHCYNAALSVLAAEPIPPGSYAVKRYSRPDELNKKVTIR
jgi:hypothetical protein